jgi:hypothetical protein
MGVVPAMAISGKFDPVTHMPATGFPYAARPQILTGQWQFMAFSSWDQGYIAVVMTKWNTATASRDTIANTFYPLPFMIMYWVKFAIPINYVSSATPDSAMIILSASGAFVGAPADQSFLYVDALMLTDSATLNTKAIAFENRHSAISPNPARELATLAYVSPADKKIKVDISDINGRIVEAHVFDARRGDNRFPLNTRGLPKGLYFVKVTADETLDYHKLIVE